MRYPRSRNSFVLSLAAAALAGLAGAFPVVAAEDVDVWPALQKDVFGAREAIESPDAIMLDAPVRAEDAALVPLTVKIPAAVAAGARKLTLIVEKNPAPVVAEFSFGPAAGDGERVLSTRVRIDMYSNVRAIVETGDGKLLMATKFVKAAGGCSAPALKDTDDALASVGKMHVRMLESADTASTMRQGQLMIRHPQYSGMQMNQLTGLYIPSKFIRQIEVTRGTELVFRMDGGFSISENPNILFTYATGGDETLDVKAVDTDGRTFTGRAGPKGS